MNRNKPILITGTQRSGTTLLNLVLDSHPDVTGIDEAEFDFSALERYLTDERYHPAVAFKLPMYAHVLREFPGIADTGVLWCIRDPRDVVASMLRMTAGNYSGKPISWANNTYGAGFEVYNCAIALGRLAQTDVAQLLGHFPRIAVKPPPFRTHQDGVYTAALCWQLKNALLPHYRAAALPLKEVRYEHLTRAPEATVADILEFLGLPWHDSVMEHHKLHKGRSIGQTDNTRPIDDRSQGKWGDTLSTDDLDVIRTVCGPTAGTLGYDLT